MFIQAGFHLRTANDWSTIVVSCKNESWSTLIRSTAADGGTFSNQQVNQNSDFMALVLSRNISKGQVIMPEDLVLTKQPKAFARFIQRLKRSGG